MDREITRTCSRVLFKRSDSELPIPSSTGISLRTEVTPVSGSWSLLAIDYSVQTVFRLTNSSIPSSEFRP